MASESKTHSVEAAMRKNESVDGLRFIYEEGFALDDILERKKGSMSFLGHFANPPKNIKVVLFTDCPKDRQFLQENFSKISAIRQAIDRMEANRISSRLPFKTDLVYAFAPLLYKRLGEISTLAVCVLDGTPRVHPVLGILSRGDANDHIQQTIGRINAYGDPEAPISAAKGLEKPAKALAEVLKNDPIAFEAHIAEIKRMFDAFETWEDYTPLISPDPKKQTAPVDPYAGLDLTWFQ